MSRLVPGDPASLSSCGSTVLRAGAQVRGRGDLLAAAYRGLAPGWPGPTSVAMRRRGAALGGATGVLVDELRGVGTALQDHATDLAGLVAGVREVEDRAARLGLEIRDGRVELGWGLVGTASAGAAASRQAHRDRVQADLDALRTRHARTREHLLRALRASSARLADTSVAVRAGANPG